MSSEDKKNQQPPQQDVRVVDNKTKGRCSSTSACGNEDGKIFFKDDNAKKPDVEILTRQLVDGAPKGNYGKDANDEYTPQWGD